MEAAPSPRASRDETVDDFLRTSARRSRAVPIRRSFVQQGAQGKPHPGPLAALVKARDVRALDLFLLHRAVASAEPWDVTRDARVWGRALGLENDTDLGAAAVSRSWHRLDTKYHLISRERRGRLVKAVALKEDGSNAAYTYPASANGSDVYFKLPYAYWDEEARYYRTLPLAAKAMLLIALSLPAGFVLPAAKAPLWYGISADTAERGLRHLYDSGLIDRRMLVKKAPQAPLGMTRELHYTLVAPFVSRPRRRVQSSRVLRSVS